MLSIPSEHWYPTCGKRERAIILDIGKMGATVGNDVCRARIGLHAYTCCDIVSAFVGNGKASALKIMTENKEVQNTFMNFGQEWDLSSEMMDKLEEFTSFLYGSRCYAVPLDTKCSVQRKRR